MNRHPDFFYGLFHSSKALTNLDKKTIIEMALKTCEEAGEMAQAVLSSERVSGCGHKGYAKEHVREEAIDVILCALSVFIRAEGDEDEFYKVMNEKIGKWLRNMERPEP